MLFPRIQHCKLITPIATSYSKLSGYAIIRRVHPSSVSSTIFRNRHGCKCQSLCRSRLVIYKPVSYVFGSRKINAFYMSLLVPARGIYLRQLDSIICPIDLFKDFEEYVLPTTRSANSSYKRSSTESRRTYERKMRPRYNSPERSSPPRHHAYRNDHSLNPLTSARRVSSTTKWERVNSLQSTSYASFAENRS